MNWKYLAELFENEYVVFATITATVFLLLQFIQRILFPRLYRATLREGKAHWTQSFLAAVSSKTTLVFTIALSLYFGTLALELPLKFEKYTDRFIVFCVCLQAWIWLTDLIDEVLTRKSQSLRQEDPSKLGSLKAISFLAYAVLFLSLALFMLDNFGINVGTLIAGLGIGGIAVALAVQSLLGDFLASLTIIFDKPFVVGETIRVEGVTGSVESIGIKTTRLRSVDGQEISLPNSKVLSSRIENFKRMFSRRVVFRIIAAYSTPAEKLKKIPTQIREIIENIPETAFERASLMQLGLQGAEFEVVYMLSTSDFGTYAEVQERVLLKIAAFFESEGIAFASPPGPGPEIAK